MSKKFTGVRQRKQLQKGNVRFTINGIDGYTKGEDGQWGYFPKVFKVSDDAGHISVDELFGTAMNVNKWGPTCVTLYSYDMLGKRTVGKIKYSGITILQPGCQFVNKP